MQEKIQPPQRSDVKATEGKPPPTSWVSENIVQYLQVESQISFLSNVLNYVKTLQHEQLSKLRTKALQLKEAFTTLPETGLPEDYANASLYNNMQGSIKTQIETLEKLIVLLQQGNPKLTPQLNTMLSVLQELTPSFPRLTPQQMQSLNAILQQLTANAKDLPQGHQRAFWNFQVYMIQAIMGNQQGDMQDYHSEANGLQAKNALLTQLTQLIDNIQTILSAKPLSPQQMQTLIEDLQTLANRYGQLTPQQQQALNSFLQGLSQFKSSSGLPLTQLLADALIQSKVSAFLQANPNATPAQVASALSAYLKQSNLQNSPLPLMQSLGQAMEQLVNTKGFPISQGFSGAFFANAAEEEPKGVVLTQPQPTKGLTSNEELLSLMLAAYAPETTSSTQLDKRGKASKKTLQETITTNQTKIQGFLSALQTLQKLQDKLGQAATWAICQSYAAGQPPVGAVGTGGKPTGAPGAGAPGPTAGLGAGPPGPGGGVPPSDSSGDSLPYQFVQALLDYYMPGQQRYLQALAMLLYIANMGAGFGNTLLDILNDFSDAGTNFNFISNLTKKGTGTNTFSGSETHAQQQLSNEKAQCSNELKNVSQSLKDISSQINTINTQISQVKNNPNLTASEKAQQISQLNSMKSQLTAIKNNLKTAHSSLVKLQTDLSGITIGPPAAGGSGFQVYGSGGPPSPPEQGWQGKIGTDENNVINGPTNAPGSGLINLSSQLNTFQTNFSNQSTTQQMTLNMVMTEVQQEWTVVSTAMQLLNQSYMTIAQGIYK